MNALPLPLVLVLLAAGCSADSGTRKETGDAPDEGDAVAGAEGGVAEAGEGDVGVDGEGATGEGGVAAADEGEAEGEGEPPAEGAEGEGEGEGDEVPPECDEGQIDVDGVCQFECQVNCDPIDQECGNCCIGARGLSHKLGGACGTTTRCHPDVLGAEEFQRCMDDQCESQICTGGFCSQRCREDADCAEAEDGPVGTNFRCRILAGRESGVCVPGSQQLCATSADCEEPGESCKLRGTGDGHVAGFCGTNYKCGQGPGELCNSDPLDGEVLRCDESLCSRGGNCLHICENDDHCDYSDAVECSELRTIYSDVPDQFRLCLGRECAPGAEVDDEGGCPEAYWCGSLNWDADDESLGFRCSADNDDPERIGLYTIECNTSNRFGPLVLCEEGLCKGRGFLRERRCVLPCSEQEDCPDEYKCEPVWVGVEDDGQVYTRMITYGACLYAPGSDRLCSGNADCDEGESCNISLQVLILDEEGEYEDEEGNRVTDGVEIARILESRCHPYEEGEVGAGEPCGQGGNACQSGLCINSSSTCAELCADTADCRNGQVCSILSLSQTNRGFIWGFCKDWEGTGAECPGPIDSCEDIEDAEDDELCLPNLLVEPTDAVPSGVEWRCGVVDGIGEPGDECDSGGDCESGICIKGIEDEERVGYCSSGCVTDDDCEELFSCALEIFRQREGPTVGAVVGRICKPWLECTGCENNDHCPGGFSCHHLRDPAAEENDVYVGMCLLDCAGEDGERDQTLCDDTQLAGRIRCRAAEDEFGDDIEGVSACQPNNLEKCFPE